MPKVSIIVPVYNGERFLEQAVGSLLTQTFTDLEVIAVDDGSTDGSLDALERMARADRRLVVRSRPNSGSAGQPKNDGLALAAGEYVGFLDCDDYSHPDRVRRLIEGLEAHPEWIAAFNDFEVVDETGRSRPESQLTNLRFTEAASSYLTAIGDGWFDCGPDFYEFMSLNFGVIHTGSVLIATNRVNFADIRFNPALRLAEDTDLWLRLGNMGRIGYLDEPLGSYRLHPCNMTRQKLLVEKYHLMVHTNNYEVARQRLSAAKLAQYRREIASMHAHLGWAHYANLAHHEAYDQYTQALAWWPKWSYRLARAKTRLPTGLAAWLREVRGRWQS